MAIIYGILKCKVVSEPWLKASIHGRETQYHLHATLEISNEGGTKSQWDCAINVGTNDSDDLLNYKLIYDFQHGIIDTLKVLPSGLSNLTGTHALPALDFLRSDVLAQTGSWRQTDIMDGSTEAEPIPSLLRLLRAAREKQFDVYVFGRKYLDGDGIHDIHMNQGSRGRFLNTGGNNDHNEIWQDGAVIVDVKQPQFAAYFTAFTQQFVPTNSLGNPTRTAHPITDADDGSLGN